MEIIKLNLKSPPIIGYLHHAYHLSIAQEHPSFDQWFNSNYIQLRYHPGTNWFNFYRLDIYNGQFDYCPLMDIQILKNTMLQLNQINFVDFCINSMKQGYYIWVYIDEYYDPNRQAFHNNHLIHENLLYGYNLNTGCFYSVGFDQEQSYSYTEISFPDLLMAFNGVESRLPVKILKADANFHYEFDIENLKNLLTDYVYSQNTSKRKIMFDNATSDCAYGIDVYKHIISYFNNLPKDGSSSDIRISHILWEHKKCMVSRMKYLLETEYLNDPGHLISAYEDIEEKATILRNLQMKYNLTGNPHIAGRMIDSLEEIRDEEINVLTELLERIRE